MNPETSRYLAGESGGSDRAPAAIFAVAVAASLAVHAGLGWAARDARVSLFEAASGSTPAQRLRLREESALRARLVPPPPPPVPGASAEPADRASASTPAELLSSMDTDAPAGIFEPPPLPAGVDASVGGLPPPPALASETEPPVPWQPREKILEIADRFAAEDLLAIPRREVAAIERDRAAADVVPEFRPAAAVESASSVPAFAWAAPVPARADLSAPSALLDVPPEAPPPVEADPAEESGSTVSAYLAEVPEEVAPAKPIENVLDASIAVYRPKAGDDAVYFRVDVRRKGADVLPPVPRNILLVQDASRSIAPERLHQCREAFKRVLASSLLPTDRFNVLSFNTSNAYAFPDGWRAPTPENVAAPRATPTSTTPCAACWTFRATPAARRSCSSSPTASRRRATSAATRASSASSPPATRAASRSSTSACRSAPTNTSSRCSPSATAAARPRSRTTASRSRRSSAASSTASALPSSRTSASSSTPRRAPSSPRA
jgi:DNA-binding protein HU-beta